MADNDRIAELVACEQIRRLVADFSHGFDKRDPELFGSVWADGGRWQVMPDGPWIEGRDSIVAALSDIWSGFTATHHWSSNHSIRVTDRGATGLLDAFCLVAPTDGGWFRVAATYTDTYERHDEGWRIASRTTQIHHYLPVA